MGWMPTRRTLLSDPVCGRTLPAKSMLSMPRGAPGKHFCSVECMSRYHREPGRYAG